MEEVKESVKTERKTRAKKTTEPTDAVNSKETVAYKEVYTAKEVDMNQYVTVINGFPGKLVCKNARTGELFVWDDIGSEQDMELRDLRNVRNTSRKFFENNWFKFNPEDDWVIDFLGVRKYYKGVINTEGIDSLFQKKPSEITGEISKMTRGQKRAVSYRATEMIRNKRIDSISVIEALESGLGISLIER